MKTHSKILGESITAYHLSIYLFLSNTCSHFCCMDIPISDAVSVAASQFSVRCAPFPVPGDSADKSALSTRTKIIGVSLGAFLMNFCE